MSFLKISLALSACFASYAFSAIVSSRSLKYRMIKFKFTALEQEANLYNLGDRVCFYSSEEAEMELACGLIKRIRNNFAFARVKI